MRGIHQGSVFSRREQRAASSGKTRTVTQWYCRVRYTGADGLSHEKKRRATNRTEALRLKAELYAQVRRELAEQGGDGARRTFADLAAYYRAEYLRPPEYRDGRKISGLRSWRQSETHLRPLELHFGQRLLSTLKFADARRYKTQRLAAPTGRKNKTETNAPPADRPRAIASVNRELELLRRLLNIALSLGWLEAHPMRGPETLIVKSHETHRLRVLTHDEETRLLRACDGEDKRAHLKPALLCALDTGLRFNEQTTLTWGDVDWRQRTLTVRALNAKTATARTVPLTSRVTDALLALRAGGRAGASADRIFPYQSFKRSFATVCRNASIEDFRWHDLRHTATVRLLEAGLDTSEVMKITGHTQIKTFLRYVNLASERTATLAARLDAYQAARQTPTPPLAADGPGELVN
jgi:integrase